MLSPRMAATAVISTAVFLGLAIVSEGGFAAFFSHGALIALALVTVAMIVASIFSNATLSSGVREDRNNRWVIAALGVFGVAAAIVPALSDRFDILEFGGENVRWLGVLLYAIGGALRLLPTFILGKRFSGLVAIQPGHRLVTDGLYGVIRNPSYLGLIIYSLGWALAFRSWLGIVLVALTLIPLHARMNSEERLLAETFGAEYQAYRARTWRLVPGVY